VLSRDERGRRKKKRKPGGYIDQEKGEKDGGKGRGKRFVFTPVKGSRRERFSV